MICPRCDASYEAGVVECPRCAVRLVGGSPGAASGGPEDLVPVFETADSALLPVLKSVLDAAGIPFTVQGDQMLGLLPLGPFGIGVRRGVLGAIVLVPRERAAEARDVLLGVAGAGADGE